MIHFSLPWILLLLPLPWFVRRIVPPATPAASVGMKIPFYSRVRHVVEHPHSSFSLGWQRHFVAYLVWGLLVVALAGPEWLGNSMSLPRMGRNIMLLVDLSGSMATPDFSFGGKNMDRLDVVKRVAGDFISHRQGDRIGLILFGTKPYLHVPLTFDTDYVKNALDNATIGLAGEFTAMGDAIGLAVNHLRNEEKNSRVIILLTDGASNTGALSPDQASLIAKQAGIRIYTIGIGADRLIVTTPFGEQIINPSADLDEDALMRIAKTTGGEFFRAKNTEKLKNIYTQINQLETVNKNNVILRPVTALYQWPLGVAFCLSLFYATRRVTRVLQYG